MGFFLEFGDGNNTVKLSFETTITTADIGGGAYAALREFVAARPACKGIADFSHVTTVDVASQTIRERAKLPPAMPGAQLFVIVAPRDHVYGLSRMFAMMAEQTRPHVHVVRTMEDAYRMLEITKPQFNRVGS
jgi:hypothetical protein